jgi:DNA-binding phage protein
MYLEKMQNNLNLKPGVHLEPHDPFETLLDEEMIGGAIWECLRGNDPEGVIEIINAHLEAVNKAELAKKARMPRSTLYHSLKGKNPTVKTLAKLIHSVEKFHK